jgi:hypothetical protein
MEDHVQHRGVILQIPLMTMSMPIFGVNVDFDMAVPIDAIELDLRLPKIGALVAVELSGVDQLQGATVGTVEVMQVKGEVLPDVLKEVFGQWAGLGHGECAKFVTFPP